MLLHPYYRQTVTQLEATTTLIDAVRSRLEHDPKVERAIKVLEHRIEVLRARRLKNIRNRGKNKR